MTHALPPLPDEDFSCAACGVAFATLASVDALSMIREVPLHAESAALATPEALVDKRPDAETWSVLEYACHLRDVFAVYAIRLYRTRTEEGPVLEPMLNDFRVARFHYNRRNLSAVLAELSDNVDGFTEEAARLRERDWDRIAVRLPGEERTARWLVRQAMHEGTHHVRDIQAVSVRVTAVKG
jgi:hypothetical protein